MGIIKEFFSPLSQDDFARDYEILRKIGAKQYINNSRNNYLLNARVSLLGFFSVGIPLAILLSIPSFYFIPIVALGICAAVMTVFMLFAVIKAVLTSTVSANLLQDFVKKYGLSRNSLNYDLSNPQMAREKWIWQKYINDHGNALLIDAYDMFNAVLNGKEFRHADQETAFNAILIKFKALLEFKNTKEKITDSQREKFLQLLSYIFVNRTQNAFEDNNFRFSLTRKAKQFLQELEKDENVKEICALLRKEFGAYLVDINTRVLNDNECWQKAIFNSNDNQREIPALQLSPQLHINIIPDTNVDTLRELRSMLKPQEEAKLN